MSYQNYELAMKLAKTKKYYHTAGGLSEKVIKQAEKMLGVKFCGQCLDFYKNYGYLSFEGVEIFTLNPNDSSGVLSGNAVALTLNERKLYSLPKEWIPIFDYQDGMLAFLDFSRCKSESEPTVIMARYDGYRYQKVEDLANDFGDFLLSLIHARL